MATEGGTDKGETMLFSKTKTLSTGGNEENYNELTCFDMNVFVN